MSSSAQPSKTGATFLWVLGAFAGFALLFALIQAFADNRGYQDPRAETRLAQRQEIVGTQAELVAKMGLKDPAKKNAIFTKTIETLRSEKPSASKQVVPGSPTQLRQAAAEAAAAPAAPTAPAAGTAAPDAAPAPAPVPAPAN